MTALPEIFTRERRSRQGVEKLRCGPLSPRIGHQTYSFRDVSSPISGRFQLNANFLNTL
jgi:hypothetical protein